MDTQLLGLPSHDDVFLTREALDLGYDERTIAKLVRHKLWTRVRHGAYCSAELWESLDERDRRRLVANAAYRSARSHVLFSHTSALDRLGVDYWDMPDNVHLTRSDGRAGRRQAGVTQHRGALVAEDVTLIDGFWSTNGTRTAIDCLTISDTEHSLVIVNCLLRARETTLDLLHRRLETITHRPGTLHAPVVMRLANPALESVGEDRTWHFFWAWGLPMPIPQYEIRDRSGRVVARVDFAWPELGVYLEFDGNVKYEALLRDGERASDVVVREKRREDMVRGLTGWVCIRITWADLFDPARLAARIRAVLAGAPRAA